MSIANVFFFFFFSSRRRHTRFDCDWSSDVCSSDLIVPIGRAEVKRPGSDVTLICHSKTVAVALKAAEQLAEHEGASAEVLDLRSLRPLDEAAILESVARTNRAVVVEEGWPHSGLGAQVV